MKVADLCNYATRDNNAELLQATSENLHGEAVNVLDPLRKRIWITTGPPPQSLLIDISSLNSRPKEGFNVFGVDCWYDFPTNPEEVEISASVDGKRFECESRVACQKEAGWQLFNIREVPSRMRYLKVTILSNFGDETTYLNQILLSYSQPRHADIDKYLPTKDIKEISNENNHPKTAVLQKELKRVQNKLESFEIDNEKLKGSNKSLVKRVTTLEETIERLIEQMEALRGAVEEREERHSYQNSITDNKATHSRNRNPDNDPKPSLPFVPRMKSNKHTTRQKKGESPSSGSELSKYQILQDHRHDKDPSRAALLLMALKDKMLQKKQLLTKQLRGSVHQREEDSFE